MHNLQSLVFLLGMLPFLTGCAFMVTAIDALTIPLSSTLGMADRIDRIGTHSEQLVSSRYFMSPSSMVSSRLRATSGIVREVQTFLSESGYYNGNIDGIYGPQTRAALEKYRQRENLGNESTDETMVKISRGEQNIYRNDEYEVDDEDDEDDD